MADENKTIVAEHFTKDRDQRERVIITMNKFNGLLRIDCRQYWYDNDGEFLPSRKGFNFSLEKWADFKEMISRFDKALQANTTIKGKKS